MRFAWCEDDAHGLDDDRRECDLYMFRGASPADDVSLWLCEEHRPPRSGLIMTATSLGILP